MKPFTGPFVFLISCLGLAAATFGAEPPIVREVFSCTFLDGKGMDDLMAARDKLVDFIDTTGQENEQHFVWTPYKTSAEVDFLWFADSADLDEFGKEADLLIDTSEGQAVTASFGEAATCTSGISMRRQIYPDSPLEPQSITPPAIINSSACNLREGIRREDLDDLWSHLAMTLSSVGAAGATFVSTPMTGSVNTPDLYLYSVQDSVSDWAARATAIRGSNSTSLRDHFRRKLECNSGLWFGERVVPLPE